MSQSLFLCLLYLWAGFGMSYFTGTFGFGGAIALLLHKNKCYQLMLQ